MYYEAGGLNVKALREENGEWRVAFLKWGGEGVPGCAGFVCACVRGCCCSVNR